MTAKILEQCKKPAAKTHIIQKTNASNSGVMKFLKHLQENSLLTFDRNSEKYETTEKGLEYLKKHSELKKILES